MSGAQIISMAPLGGENSSYALAFDGPTVQCSESKLTQSTISEASYVGTHVVVYNGTWPSLRDLDNQSVFILTQSRVVGYYPAPIWTPQTYFADGTYSFVTYPPDDMSVNIILEHRTLHCEAHTTTYSVNISYAKGIRRIEYTTGNTERFRHVQGLSFRWNATENRTMPTDTEEYKEWESQVRLWKEKANSRAILDSVGYNLEYQWAEDLARGTDNKTKTYLLPNGTEIALGLIENHPQEMFPGYRASKQLEVLPRTTLIIR